MAIDVSVVDSTSQINPARPPNTSNRPHTSRPAVPLKRKTSRQKSKPARGCCITSGGTASVADGRLYRPRFPQASRLLAFRLPVALHFLTVALELALPLDR